MSTPIAAIYTLMRLRRLRRLWPLRLNAALLAALSVVPFASAMDEGKAGGEGARRLNQAQFERVEEIVITARRDSARLSELPAGLTVFSAEEITLGRHAHIQELLSAVPGASFQRTDGQEYLPAIRSAALTGAGGCGGILILENGVPLRPVGFCNVNELFESHSEQAQRIEVLRGPASALHGSKALHGLVQVLTPAHSRGSVLDLGLAEHRGRSLRARFADESLAVAATLEKRDSFRAQSGYSQQKLSARLARRLSGGTAWTSHFTATHLDQRTAGFIQGEQAYKDRAAARQNPFPNAFREARSARFSTHFETPEGWRLTPYLRWSDMAFLQHFLPATPVERNGQRSGGVLVRHERSLGARYELISGADVELARMRLSETQEEAHSNLSLPIGRHYDYRVSSLLFAPFAQLIFNPTEHWEYQFAVRFERLRYDYDNHMSSGSLRADGTSCPEGCRYSRPEDGVRRFDNYSPQLSVSWRWREDERGYGLAFARIANGFRAPHTSELYRLQRGQLEANLDAEQLQSFELGLRGVSGDFGYEVVTYRMRKREQIFRDARFFYLSGARSSHKGLEFAADFTVSACSLRASANFARHRYENDPGFGAERSVAGNDLDTAPRRSASFDMSCRPTQNLHLAFNWRYFGAYWMDASNRVRYPGHRLLGVNLRWDYGADRTQKIGVFRSSLSLKISNLSDATYAERADYVAFAGGNERYLPGAPRTISLGLILRFN